MKFVEDKNVTSHLQSWLSPLVSRYNDLFTNLRVSCMDHLQSLGQSDCARNQRLIFHAVQVSYHWLNKKVINFIASIVYHFYITSIKPLNTTKLSVLPFYKLVLSHKICTKNYLSSIDKLSSFKFNFKLTCNKIYYISS